MPAVIGVRGPGRPPKLSAEQQATIQNMLMHSDKTVKQCAKMFKCLPGHIYRTVGTKQEMVALAAKQAAHRGDGRRGQRVKRNKVN